MRPGESINKGKFIPFDQQRGELMIKPSPEDVTASLSIYGRACVAMSPGPFSDASMELLDPWLFVKAAVEKVPPMKDLLMVSGEKSPEAEMIKFAGTEHGGRIPAAQPELAEMIAV